MQGTFLRMEACKEHKLIIQLNEKKKTVSQVFENKRSQAFWVPMTYRKIESKKARKVLSYLVKLRPGVSQVNTSPARSADRK